MSSNSKLFSFAVLGDTHIITKDDVGASPYPVNDLATERSISAVKTINKCKPDFAIHIGDMVRPFPSLKSYIRATKKAKTIFSKLNCKIYFIPGNHDIGDKPNLFSPAPIISKFSIDKYKSAFGNFFYSFTKKNCKFIFLNSSLVNSSLEEELIQYNWVKNELNSSLKKRIFVFMHYPLFLANSSEISHYDNIDEPGRSKLLRLFSKYKVEAIFSGHVHQFFYNVFNEIDMYSVPSTSFLRHDFSEIFHIEPTFEFGRDDSLKLGFFMVDVYKKQHFFKLINTLDKRQKITKSSFDLISNSTFGTTNPIGIKFRHSWNEKYSLPFNLPLDEFNRKKARNDYLLLAVFQTGITHIRLPILDLIDDDAVERIRGLLKKGKLFTFFHFGKLNNQILKLVYKYYKLFHNFEIIISNNELNLLSKSISKLKKKINLEVTLGILNSSSNENLSKTKYFRHSTTFGFHKESLSSINTIYKKNEKFLKIFDAFSFQIHMDDNCLEIFKEIDRFCKFYKKSALIHLNTFNLKSSIPNYDDYKIANFIILLAILTFTNKNIKIFIDSIMDVDRGSHPRNGIVDRRGNLRLTSYYLQKLIPQLNEISKNSELEIKKIKENSDLFVIVFSNNKKNYLLSLIKKNVINIKNKLLKLKINENCEVIDL